MRKLKHHQYFRAVVTTGTRLFDYDMQANFIAIGSLALRGLLVLPLAYLVPFAPSAVIAASGASDHSTESAQPSPDDSPNIRIDNHTYTPQNAGQSWSLNSPDPDTLRFELRHGDHWSSSYWTDPATSERDEIAGQTVYPPGVQINIAYDFMIEPGQTNSASGPGHWLVLGQMHEYQLSNSPPLAIELVNGDHMAVDIGTKNPVYVYIDPNPIQRGQYYSMNIQVKFANNHDGFLEIWRNGAHIVDYQGTLGTGAGIYWKQGVYRSAAKESIAMHVRNLKITTAAMVTGISAASAKGEGVDARTIAVSLHLSEAVTVSGTPILMFSDGSTATYTGGSGTDALIFDYAAGPGDTGTIPEVTGVDLPNDAAVKDAHGAAANLSIASVARSGLRPSLPGGEPSR